MKPQPPVHNSVEAKLFIGVGESIMEDPNNSLAFQEKVEVEEL